MAGGISSIYHKTTRLKAVNKLTLDGVSFGKKKGKPLKKRKNKKPHKKPSAKPISEEARHRIETSERAFAARPVEELLKMLGPLTDLHIDKIGFKRQTLPESKDFRKCQICLMCNGNWYSVAELISAGFLDEGWRDYSSMLGATARKKGLQLLSDKFGLMVNAVRLRAKTSFTPLCRGGS